MKKYKLIISIFALLILFSACKKSSILDKSPQDQYSDATLWSDIDLADAYLLDAYHGARIGFTMGMLAQESDEACYGSDVYVEGSITPEDVGPWGGTLPSWNDYFLNIQKLNVFITKIGGVVNAYSASEQAVIKAEADIKKGEALFLRAFCYSQLVRTYGGVPIFKEALKLGDDFTSVLRGTFEETINFISDDCDAAAALLPDKDQMLLGRATKGAALALKSRVLLFAASDLTADGTAVNSLVGYENPNRNALWTAAKDAAKEVMDLGTYQLADFGAPDKVAVANNYYNFFRAKDLSNSEIIWGKMYSLGSGDLNQMNQWCGGNSWDVLEQGGWGYNAPIQSLVDAYQMEDGSNFLDHFNLDADGNYQNISSKFLNKNPYENRDPRFYGSILYDDAIWMKRTGAFAAIDPIGVYDRRTRVIINGGTIVSTTYGLDSRQGPVNTWNGSITGYVMKKMLDNEIGATSKVNDNVWIEFRYAEVLLNYAESCIELGETDEAASYINMIRTRAGLPHFTGDITEALRYERRIELVFENSRWYDIRRWKILEQTLTDAKGINITETNTDGNVTTTWEQIMAQQRNPEPKMYWVPIATDEVKKSPQLEQNPGY